MRVDGYFMHPDDLRAYVAEDIFSWPECLRPETYGYAERRSKSDKRVDDITGYRAFVHANSGGFMLHGREILADVSIFDNMPSGITAWCSLRVAREHPETVLDVLASLARGNAMYGFACDTEEREARNQYIVRYELGKSYGWFGRDFERYVPGLYWANWFSKRYVKHIGIDPLQLHAQLGGELRAVDDRGDLLVLFDSPFAWKSHYEHVGNVIRRTDRVFSRDQVELPRVLGAREHDEWSAWVFREWP